jgi:hypothetical protein
MTFLRSSRALWVALAFLFCLGVYVLRMDSVAGAFVDDAWYTILAKSLATGHGFTVINSPTQGILPLYPPGFPAVLSLVFRLNPSFPSNVWALKCVSVASLFLSAPLIFFYLERKHRAGRAAAFGIILLTLITPAFVFLATSTLMSECFFTLIQLAAIVCVEQSLEATGRRRSRAFLVAGACLAALAFLTRPVAVGLVCAAALYLLLKRRFAFTLAFVAIVCLLVGPWMLYTRAHAPTTEQKFEQQGLISTGYAQNIWKKVAGDANSADVGVKDLPARALDNMWEICARDTGGLVLPALFRNAEESGQETLGMAGTMGMATDTIILSTILFALSVVGFVVTLRRGLALSELTLLFTLPVILLWPWLPFRFLVPFTPFLFLYLLRGISAAQLFVSQLLRRGGDAKTVGADGRLTAAARVFLMCAILLNVYDHVGYILGKFGVTGARPLWVEYFKESEELMDWMRDNLERTAVVATENPALVNLHTGLKTVSSPADPEGKKEDLERRHVRYLVHISAYHVAQVSTTDERYKFLRQTDRQVFFVIELGSK